MKDSYIGQYFGHIIIRPIENEELGPENQENKRRKSGSNQQTVFYEQFRKDTEKISRNYQATKLNDHGINIFLGKSYTTEGTISHLSINKPKKDFHDDNQSNNHSNYGAFRGVSHTNQTRSISRQKTRYVDGWERYSPINIQVRVK